MRVKYTIILLFFLSISFAQNEDVLAKKYSYSYTKYNVYGFFDVVRFAVVGAEYRPVSFFALDFKVGAIYPNGIFHTAIAANDFFSDKGIGLMLSPKLYPGAKKRFYIGFNAAFYAYGYKKSRKKKALIQQLLAQTTTK